MDRSAYTPRQWAVAADNVAHCRHDRGQSVRQCLDCKEALFAEAMGAAVETYRAAQAATITDNPALHPDTEYVCISEALTERDAERQRAEAAERSLKYSELGYQAMRDNIAQRDRRIAELEARHAIARQMANVIYNCAGAPEQWERGKRILIELLGEFDAAPASPATAGHIPGQVCEGGCSMKCVKKPGVSLDTHTATLLACQCNQSPCICMPEDRGCVVCGFDEQDHIDNPLITHRFNPPPRYDKVFFDGVAALNKDGDK